MELVKPVTPPVSGTTQVESPRGVEDLVPVPSQPPMVEIYPVEVPNSPIPVVSFMTNAILEMESEAGEGSL
jgi:hypothetical protein